MQTFKKTYKNNNIKIIIKKRCDDMPKKWLPVILLLLVFFTSIGLYKAYADQCSILIKVVDQNQRPLGDTYITIFVWYPGEPSEILASGKTNNRGEFTHATSWNKIVGKWLERRRRERKVEDTALIVLIHNPLANVTLTDTIPIRVTPHNPHFIKKTIRVRTKHTYSALATNNEKQTVKPQRYISILEEWYEYTGKINLAHIKTDSATKAHIHYAWAQGEKTRVRLVYGYSYSEETQVSGDPIYGYTHSLTFSLDKPATAGQDSEAYVSVMGTLRVEIWAHYWPGIVFREARLWMYDLDGSTLSNEKGDDPYWGAYSLKLVKRGTGNGFEIEDAAFDIWHLDLYINYELTEVPISEALYFILLRKVEKYPWLEKLLPQFHVVMDHLEWKQSGVCFTIWGAEGYDIAAQARYVDAHGICLMAIDLASQPPSPWPIY